MESFAKLISAVSALAWPVVFGILLIKLFGPIRALVESAKARRFTIKVAGNELTMEEASEQQRQLLNDVQTRLAELEKHLVAKSAQAEETEVSVAQNAKRILWVDDRPKNNSFLVASLEEREAQVDIALSTKEGLAKFRSSKYDVVVSDMGRPEADDAGIDLARKIRAENKDIPVYIYCGTWAAKNMREASLQAGVTDITSSGTRLLGFLLRS